MSSVPVHYSANMKGHGRTPACNCSISMFTKCTNNPKEVTCKRCKKTLKKKYPKSFITKKW